MADQTSSGQSYVPLNKVCEACRLVKVGLLPNHLFNRVIYALVVLVKTALLDNISTEPSSLITHQDISRAGPYLTLCLDKTVEAEGMTNYRIPSLFSGMVVRLRKWYHYQLQR